MRAKDLILERLPSLGPQTQAAARYVVDHPNEVVIESMRSLAERADAQPATLVRLAQHLGFAGWPELKALFAEDLGLSSASYGQRARKLATRGRNADLLAELFGAQRRNLDVTHGNGVETLRAAARLLRRAQRVHVAGFRASFPIAYSLVYGWRLFAGDVFLLDGQGGGLELQLRPIGRHDAVIVISFAPYSRECLLVIEAARAAGAKLVALTDSEASPLARGADAAVIFAIDSPSFFPSVVAGIAVAEALLELLVAEGGTRVVRRIERAEQQLVDLGAYLEPAARRGTSR